MDYSRFYVKEAVTDTLMHEVKEALDEGRSFPLPTVYEKNGIYYVEDSVEAILASRLLKKPLVNCTLLGGEPAEPDAYRKLF